eukprot:GHVL01040002.1.p1 GENE.GHVL01040002.1~~GHVL01040002.1.p1  ORF type:complete len:312 (+),score=65.92 GHVL01040002.1:315-1250(+)
MKKMSTINARFEGMTSSPIYRRLVNSHRCVFVVDGFYEWKTTAEGQKLPHFIRCPGTKNELKDESTSETLVKNESNDKNTGITSKTLVKNESDDGVIAILSDDEEALYFAGLYDIWREGETVLYTCSIVTMDSINTPMEHVHKRMPVFLSSDSNWLSNCEIKSILPSILQNSKNICKNLHIYPVGSQVSNIRMNTIACIQPLQKMKKISFLNGIGRYYKVESTIDKKVESTIDKKVDSTIDKKVESTIDKKVETTIDKKVESTIDKKVESTIDKKVESTIDKKVESTIDSPKKKPKLEQNRQKSRLIEYCK